MTISKTLATLTFAASLALFGCKKSDDAAPAATKVADPATATPAAPTPATNTAPAAAPGAAAPAAAAPTAAAPAAAAPASAAPAAAADPAAVTIGSDDEYMTKGTAMLDKIFALFSAAGTDCDKLADGVTAFANENGALVKGLDAYEKSHADAKKKFDDATKEKTEKFGAAAVAVMKTCKDNKKLADAMTKLGG